MKKTVIVDERIPKVCLDTLAGLGFSCITLPPSDALPTPLSSHTDILAFRHEGTLISSEEYRREHPFVFEKIKHELPYLDIRFSSEGFGRAYPRDAIFNALVIGDKIFCKTDSVCRDVLAYADDAGLKIISVKQGYPACTVLAVSDTRAITSDDGMARALGREGIEVLKIPESDKILLPPYKNGFIGGTAGRCGSDIYFAGNPRALPCFDEIEKFAGEVGVKLTALDRDADCLIDVGGLAFCE